MEFFGGLKPAGRVIVVTWIRALYHTLLCTVLYCMVQDISISVRCIDTAYCTAVHYFGCWVLDVRCSMSCIVCSMLCVGCWMLGVGCWFLDVVCWMLDVGCWMLCMLYVGC
jgi:hypothetical protein